ncbi:MULTISPECIES: ribosome maturation factor RimM [Mumia]|uniref:ribosome maturation factor RimM n=1 Tax=Mumia TaxID=1546255 RepID=UPI00141E4DD5|nr:MULTISPECIES: ribosome maturation factor RimM [unclassified Mumia]QMW65071.1 ribosome maturation factor RimM [Mumia sp. ZJ1417]
MEIVVGRIGRAHGIRGEVSIDLTTDEPERRFAPGSSVVVRPKADAARTMRIRAIRPHQGRLLVTFDELLDRTAAEKLRGAQVVVDVDVTERPEDPEEFYDHQLVDLRVQSGGADRGVVRDVLHLPAQDMLAVERSDGVEVLVPFVAALVTSVDLAAGVIHVAPVEGLLDPELSEDAGP